MEWFKFYGKDWLTDIKILNMSIEDRLCYLTLLCLASASEEQGIIKNCKEESILKLTQLYLDPYDSNNEYNRAVGFLKRLHDNKMITIDNKNNVIINAFIKRQSINLSGYERVKRYRDRQNILKNKELNQNDNNDNVNDNTVITLDKIRIDKNTTPAKAGSVSFKKKTMKNYKETEINYETGEIVSNTKKENKNKEAIRLAKMFDEMASNLVGKRIATSGSYFIVLKAMDKPHMLTSDGIELLFKDWFDSDKIKDENKVKLSWALGSANINSFKVKN